MGDNNRDSFVILPPGFEFISQIIYGELEIKIKKLNFLNVLHKEGDVRVRLHFYGEKGASHLLVPQNSSKDLLRYFKTSYKYLVGCSIWKFQQYLLDMNMLKLSIVDHNNLILGFVDIVYEHFLDDQITENSESLFKNLRGNFAITSTKNPNQKIGSIEIEIQCLFDVEISRFVKKAEIKYQQGELSEQVEDYVMRMIQQKQNLSNTAINPQYNNSSYEQTQTLTVKPEYQDMFGQRIPASLVDNNENYLPEKYSASNFYQDENNRSQKINQNEDYQRRGQSNQQQFNVSQQQLNNQQGKNVVNNSGMKQNNNLNNSGIKQTMRQQANQSNGNINNSTQNRDNTNPNDNAFVLSSENSLMIQRQNEMTQDQLMKMNEIEKTNKQITSKLDKLVSIGEQFYVQYQDHSKQQKILEQQKIKEEQTRIEIENKRLQLQSQKIQLKEKELQLQQEEKEKQAQKENQQQTFKQTNPSHAPFQRTDIKGNNPFPVNQQLFQKNRIKIQIFDFNCKDKNFLSKISQKNIYIECVLPPNFNCKQQDANIMKTVCKNIQDNVFNFNTEINQYMSLLPEKINELLNEQIQFEIKAFSIPKNTIDLQRNNDLVTLLSTSTLNLKEFLAKSVNFNGIFHLDMKTRFSSSSTQEKQQQSSKQMVIKKQDLKPVQNNEESIVGTLKVGISMFQDVQQGTIYSQHQRRTNMTLNNQFTNTTNQYSNIPQQQTIQIVKQPTVSFQLYLKFSNLQIISNINDFTNKKIYLQFKVYGTQENITTKQLEMNKSNHHSFDSEFFMPCNKDMIIKMRKVPFIIEVWVKNYEKQDELLGILNLNLSQISSSVLNKNNNYNDNWCSSIENARMIIIASSEFREFVQIPSKKVIGQIFTTLVFGSVAQISKFKETQPSSQANNFNGTISEREHVEIDKKQQIQQPQVSQNIQEQMLSDIPDIKIINQTQHVGFNQNSFVNQGEHIVQIKQANATINEDNSIGKQSNKKDQTNKNKLTLNQYLPENSMTSTELIYIETFECLRVNDTKIKNRIREFINSLRPPQYFIKQFDLFNFLSNLPIKWPSIQNLVFFCKFFDYQNVSYYESELFTKSYSAYLLVEEQIRNTLSSIIQAFQEILNINRITSLEFEKILNSNSKFGYASKEDLQNTLQQLTLAGLDQSLIENILRYLSKEKDAQDTSLINVGQIIEYLKQVETYSKIRNLYQYDEQLFRTQIINNLKYEIQVNRIQISSISEEKTQNCLEIDIKLCKDLFQLVGIELTYWESFCILKEIQELNNQITNMNYILKVPVLQFNQYLLNLENTILEQSKLANNSIRENDSEIRDLNMMLNKSLLKQRQQQQKDYEKKDNNSQMGSNKKEDVIEEHLMSYQFKFTIASLTEMKIKEEEDGKIVYIRYLLPLEDQNWIDSGIFELNYSKENYYRFALYGTHKIVIKNTENLQNVFKSNQVLIEIRELSDIDNLENKSEVSDNLIAKSFLDVNNLLGLFENGDSNYVSRITSLQLVNNQDISIGNINFKIEFKKEIVKEDNKMNEDVLFAKEQQVQKLLPKQGNLTINIKTNNLEEECIVQFKLFKDDTYLNHLFEPIQSKNEIVNKQYFISISQDIVKYFGEGSALVRILDKEGQILLGEYEFNLINILVSQQITLNESILNLINHKPIDLDISLIYEKSNQKQQQQQ